MQSVHITTNVVSSSPAQVGGGGGRGCRGRDLVVVPIQPVSITLMLWVRISIRARCATLCDNVCQWLATGRWFSPFFRFPP